MSKKTWMAAALLGAAQACLADDLASVYRDALANDAQYAAAKAQYAAVEERVPQALAGLLPAISVNANSLWNDIDGGVGGSQGYNSHGYTVSLTQPLLRWQNKLGVDQSRLLVDQARAQLELARQELIVRVAQAYFDVLLAQDNLATLDTQRVATAEQLALATRSLDIGTATITDVRDAKARFDLVNAQIIAAKNELANKRHALRVLTDREPGALVPLRSGAALAAPAPNDIEHWAAAAASDGLGVAAGRVAVAVARLEEKKAAAGHYPTLDLTATQGRAKSATVTTIGSDLSSATVGVQLTVPLYSGGGVAAREREVAALLAKAQAELDGARRNGVLAARQAFLGVTAGLAQMQALDAALGSARTALEANKRGLEVGVRVNIDVLNAQQQVAATERDLARSRYDTLLALLRLKGAAGSLAEGDVAAVNLLLAMR